MAHVTAVSEGTLHCSSSKVSEADDESKSTNLQRALTLPALDPVTVTVEGLSFYVFPRRQKCNQKIPEKQILKDCSLIARPGELLAIIGPSGCGKTTLLNNIAGRFFHGRSEGSIKFNGVSLDRQNVNEILSFVMTHDKQLHYLTVEETLMFAAKLKLHDITQSERKERVEQLINEVGLTECRKTPIGGQWKKGISTGELKRVSIAVELLDNPSVLLLDEPTSGLDSFLALELIQLLSKMAKSGRTVIMSIHQPRSQIFASFDQLLLMSSGRVVYYGDAAAVKSYMAQAGFHCPERYNPADFLLDLVSEKVNKPIDEYGDVEEQASARLRLGADEVRALADRFAESEGARKLAEEMQRIGMNPDPIILSRQCRMEERFLQKVRAGCHCSTWTKWILEFQTLWKRSTLDNLRNPILSCVMLLLQSLMGVLLGGIFYMSNSEPHGLNGQPLPVPQFASEAFSMASDWTNVGYHPLEEIIVNGVSPIPGKPSVPALVINETAFPLNNIFSSVHGADQYFDCVFDYMRSNSENYEKILDAYRDWPVHFAQPATSPFSLIEQEPTPWEISNVTMKMMVLADFAWTRVDWKDIPEQIPGRVNPLGWWFAVFQKYPVLLNSFTTCMNLPKLEIQPLFMSFVPKPNYPPKERRLAISASMLSDMDVSSVFSPRVIQFFDATKSLVGSLRSCDHSFCRWINRGIEEGSSWAGTALASILAVLNAGGCLFFTVGNLGFASYDTLLTFPQERALLNRETSNKMYSESAWFLAKNITDLPFQLIPSLTLVSIYYWMVGMTADAGYFFRYLGICICISYVAYGFGYMLSAASKSMEVAMILAPLMLMIMLCLSGFFVRDASYPVALAWMKYLSFYRWGYFALAANQFPPGGYWGGLPNELSLAVLGITEIRVWNSIAVLLLLGTIFRVTAFVLVKFLHRGVGLEM